MYVIEICLRELIIHELANANGAKWYKSALPSGAIMDKYASSTKYQKTALWQSMIPAHPIYSLDFPELTTIIERKNNWAFCFSKFFHKKENIIPQLRSLEPIRNSIAHNRQLSAGALENLQTTFHIFCKTITNDKISELLTASTKIPEIGQILVEIQTELHNCTEAISNAKTLPVRPSWGKSKNSWWFDSEYLGADTSSIERVYNELLPSYEQLPKGWGSAVTIDKWRKTSSFDAASNLANGILEDLIKLWRNHV